MPRKKQTPAPSPLPHSLDYISEQLRHMAVPIAELVPDPNNARKHSDKSIAAVAASLKTSGQLKSIIVNSIGNVVLCGNGTLAAAKTLGWTHLAALRQEFTEKQARAISIADNRTAEQSEWDPDRLVEMSLLIEEDIKGSADLAALYEKIDFADLLPKKPVVVEADKEPVAVVYEVVVGCKNEEDQKRVFERMQGENRKCRLLTM